MNAIPKAVKELERQLPQVLTEIVQGNNPFPVIIELPNPIASWDHLQVMAHHEVMRSLVAKGGTLQWETRRTLKLGKQTWPVAWQIEDLPSLARILKSRDLIRFPALCESVLRKLPELRAWWIAHPQQALALRGRWSGLVHALEWFRDHPASGLHRREIPWRLHGKFVEENRALLDILFNALSLTDSVRQTLSLEERLGLRTDASLVRIRLGTEERERSGLPSDDLAMAMDAWQRLDWRPKRVLVVENLATFLALPVELCGVCVWGQGFAVTRLGHWLEDVPEVRYWGDLDAQGFEILDRLRAVCPKVLSVGMDGQTWERHRFLACAGTPSSLKGLDRLTREEWTLYRRLLEENRRLEQEKIPLHTLSFA